MVLLGDAQFVLVCVGDTDALSRLPMDGVGSVDCVAIYWERNVC